MPARLSASDLASLRTRVCGCAGRFDADELHRDDAVAALHEWAAIANAAETAAALAAARIETCGPPPSAGARDAAEFVARATGTTPTKAKERIKTGARLSENDSDPRRCDRRRALTRSDGGHH